MKEKYKKRTIRSAILGFPILWVMGAFTLSLPLNLPILIIALIFVPILGWQALSVWKPRFVVTILLKVVLSFYVGVFGCVLIPVINLIKYIRSPF